MSNPVIKSPYPQILTGTTIPTTTPEFIGQIYIDTNYGIQFIAKGTSSSFDWVPQLRGEIDTLGFESTAIGTYTTNYHYTCRYMCNRTGVIKRLGFPAAASGGSVEIGIYSDNSGEPNSLLTKTSQVSIVGDVEQSFEVITPIIVTEGTYYWIAIGVYTNSNLYYHSGEGTMRYFNAGTAILASTWNTAGDTHANNWFKFFGR